MTPRTAAPAISIRPLRHLIDLWLVLALYIALKGIPGGADKATNWGIFLLAILISGVWLIGRSPRVQRFFQTLLVDSATGESAASEDDIVDSSVTQEPKFTIALPHLQQRRNTRMVWLCCLGGFTFVAALLALLEIRQPFYFVQDDNSAQFLPVVLQGCRSLLNDGVFPTWNPYQFLGSPTTSLGTYALTYPPTYVAYAIARWIVGNEAVTFDVFCIGHLLAGYLATFWACRLMQIRPMVAAAASACFAISGFFLIAGRSWYYMTPTAAWMPVLVVLIEKLRRQEVGWRWVLATGLSLGAMFHSGNAQMWCYGILLFGIAILVLILSHSLSTAKVIAAGSAVLLGVAISLPLLLPQYLETAKLERFPGDSNVLRCLPSMLLPFPLARSPYPGVTQTPNLTHIGHLYYAGTVFTVIALLGMLSLMAHRWSRRVLASNIWLVMAWIALILALGRIGGLWYLLSKLPAFNGFKHSFKFIPFATLFMMIGGAMLLERAMRSAKTKRRLLEATATIAVALLLTYHACMSTPSFCDYGFRPYPAPPAEIQALNDPANPARMYAIAPRRSLAPEYGQSMMHQLPSVWGWYAFEGYDPLVRRGPRFGSVMDKLFAPTAVSGMQVELGWAEMGLEEPMVNNNKKVEDALHRSGMDEDNMWGHDFHIDLAQALTALRAYGVRWVMLYTGRQIPNIPEGHSDEMFWRTDPVAEQVAEAVQERGRLIVRSPAVSVYELKNPAPLAFINGKSKIALPIKFTGAGAIVDTSSLTEDSDVVVNVVGAPFLKARVDGTTAPATTDRWGRLVFHVTAGAQELRLGYQPPWLIGTAIGLVLAGIAAAAMYRRDQLSALAGKYLSRSKSPLILRLRQAA
jgi:hypothetical protein